MRHSREVVKCDYRHSTLSISDSHAAVVFNDLDDALSGTYPSHVIMLIATRLQPPATCGLPRAERVWSVVDHTAARSIADLGYLGCSSFAIKGSERKQANPRRDPDS